MIVYEDCHFGEKGHRACYEFRDFSVVPHFHRSNELLYVEEGKIKEFTVTLGELTEDEREIILKGCLINYNRGRH